MQNNIIYPWPKEMYEYIRLIWRKQGSTHPYRCSGMASFCFWPERILYDATDDSLVRL